MASKKNKKSFDTEDVIVQLFKEAMKKVEIVQIVFGDWIIP